jgi:uncharacterized membrane protein HdeD (DUF308 family)
MSYTPSTAQIRASALEDLQRHRGLFLVLGIALIVLGTIAIFAAGLFTLASVVFFGWLLMIGGGALVVHAFWARRWGGFFLQLLSGLLHLVVGWLFVARPGVGAVTLTLVFAISLVVQGTFRIGAALSAHVDGRGSLLLSGLVTLVLGLLIWNEWPLSGLWVIGLFLGVDMIVYGWWIVSLAMAARPATAST